MSLTPEVRPKRRLLLKSHGEDIPELVEFYRRGDVLVDGRTRGGFKPKYKLVSRFRRRP